MKLKKLLASPGGGTSRIQQLANRTVAKLKSGGEFFTRLTTSSYSLRLHQSDSGVACQKRHQVDEVACLAYDSTAANLRVIQPVAGREWSGVHSVIHHQRTCMLECLSQCPRMRRESAIESHHQHARGHRGNRLDPGELSVVQSQWFLDEDMLPRLERAGGKLGVVVVAGRD